MNEDKLGAIVTQEWQSIISGIDTVGSRLVGQLARPEDGHLRHELYRYYFSALTNTYLSLLVNDQQHPDFQPAFNDMVNFLAVNPDGRYLVATIDPEGVYRVSGFRGTTKVADVQIGLGALVPEARGDLGGTGGNHRLDSLTLGEDGAFSVVISAERPKGYAGDWWEMHPEAKYLMTRQFAADWLNEQDAVFAIERLDTPAAKPRRSLQKLDERLHRMVEGAHRWVEASLQYIDNNYRKGNLINKVRVQPLPQYGGLSKQAYIEGMFDFEAGEALLYEVTVPEHCVYWNLHLGDELWEMLDWQNRQTSLNNHTAVVDSDGKLRVVIAAEDPGVANWLDTVERHRGIIFGRWTECSDSPTPSITKIKLTELTDYLPADTVSVSAEEREQSIRARRRAHQLRRRW